MGKRNKVVVEDPFRVKVDYAFTFDNGESATFSTDVDLEKTSSNIKHKLDPLPLWTDLDHEKCTDCPLKREDHSSCPAAASIADIIEHFSATVSYSTCTCVVTTPEKEITVRNKPVQDALYPLLGLRMATSECPYLRQFAPLARFHEPFSTQFSTVFRTTSYFLLRRFIESDGGKTGTINLDGLGDFYKKIGDINYKILKRLESAKTEDATPNSIFVLSLFGVSMTFLFSEYAKIIRQLFKISERELPILPPSNDGSLTE